MNPEDFDALVQDLQAAVDAKDREDFSAYALDLAKHPYKLRPLPKSPTIRQATVQSSCGDEITVYFDIKAGMIVDVGLEVNGCVANVITGSQAIKMIDGKPVLDALALSEAALKAALGKFPDANYHCIVLAINGIRKALA